MNRKYAYVKRECRDVRYVPPEINFGKDILALVVVRAEFEEFFTLSSLSCPRVARESKEKTILVRYRKVSPLHGKYHG